VRLSIPASKVNRSAGLQVMKTCTRLYPGVDPIVNGRSGTRSWAPVQAQPCTGLEIGAAPPSGAFQYQAVTRNTFQRLVATPIIAALDRAPRCREEIQVIVAQLQLQSTNPGFGQIDELRMNPQDPSALPHDDDWWRAVIDRFNTSTPDGAPPTFICDRPGISALPTPASLRPGRSY